MDPDAAARAYFEAIEARDYLTAAEHASNLQAWRFRGGFDSPEALRARRSWAHVYPNLTEGQRADIREHLR